MENPKYKQDYLENEYGKFWIEDGIVIEFFKPFVTTITLEVAVHMVKSRLEVSNGITMPLLVDLNNAKTIDIKAREFFSEGESIKFVSASAFLLHNYIHWIGGKLFLSINTPKVKIELFRSRKKALDYLRNFKYEILN